MCSLMWTCTVDWRPAAEERGRDHSARPPLSPHTTGLSTHLPQNWLCCTRSLEGAAASPPPFTHKPSYTVGCGPARSTGAQLLVRGGGHCFLSSIMSIYMCINIQICIDIYVYIYVDIYVYIYIYI